MSEIKNGGLDQYGDEPFEQQQFGTAGDEWVNDYGLTVMHAMNATFTTSSSALYTATDTGSYLSLSVSQI